VEAILSANPDVESYSRRLGAEMGMFITEPYRGDFAVKLKRDRTHTTDEVIAELRHTYNEQFPAIRWDFPRILTDVIGDLQLTPDPIEIKIFSPDLKWLKETAPRVEAEIKKNPGVVDTFDGLTETGPSINFRVRPADAARFGLSVQDIADAVNTAQLGQTASYVLEGDRIVNIRVLDEPSSVDQLFALRDLPLRAANGTVVRLNQVADVSIEPSEVKLDRDDLRQDIIVSARLEGRDLGGAIKDIRCENNRQKFWPCSLNGQQSKRPR
jgi:multidrug efflux pump subunit AcrB